mmetsp:Transcript_29568/g.75283  ORF Transcript_29568/g.75283 Transcript_29568/m.75283 type:complete len:234 (+) Transcript_29568:856-1557(+)
MRSMRFLASRTSMMCKCCSSLRIWRFCCSPSRRCCTTDSRSMISTSLPSPSILRSSCIWALFTFIALTRSRKTAPLSLTIAFLSSWNRCSRSCSATISRAKAACFSSKSDCCLAMISLLCASLAFSLAPVFCPTSAKNFWVLALFLSRSSNFSCRIPSFFSWSSFSLTRELCCLSCPLRSVSNRFASFSKRFSSMPRNCALWTPGNSPFLALLAMTLARSARTWARRSLRFFS